MSFARRHWIEGGFALWRPGSVRPLKAYPVVSSLLSAFRDDLDVERGSVL